MHLIFNESKHTPGVKIVCIMKYDVKKFIYWFNRREMNLQEFNSRLISTIYKVSIQENVQFLKIRQIKPSNLFYVL